MALRILLSVSLLLFVVLSPWPQLSNGAFSRQLESIGLVPQANRTNRQSPDVPDSRYHPPTPNHPEPQVGYLWLYDAEDSGS